MISVESLRALSLPCLALFLDPADMHALDSTSHEIVVAFEVLSRRFRHLQHPEALARALYYRGEWGSLNCERVYEDTTITPYKNKKTFVTHFVRHVLNHEELWRFGVATKNLRIQRLSVKRSRAAARARQLKAKAKLQANTR
jgi:hypothetical protein